MKIVTMFYYSYPWGGGRDQVQPPPPPLNPPLDTCYEYHIEWFTDKLSNICNNIFILQETDYELTLAGKKSYAYEVRHSLA